MPPGSASLLQSGGNVHAVAEDVAILLDHDVAEIDADAKLKGLGIRLAGAAAATAS